MKELTNNFKNIFTNNYANFNGRADRSEIWLFNAVLYFIYLVVYMLMYPFIIIASFTSSIASRDMSAYNQSTLTGILVMYGVFFLLILPFIIPSLALGVRRLHDTNRSGWYLLLNLIPLVGGLIVTVLLCIDGDRGSNQYGEDPKIKKYTQQL